MLKFVNEAPAFQPEDQTVVFNGLEGRVHVTCQVTVAALEMRAELEHANVGALLQAFTQHRQFLEDVACVLHVRGEADCVLIDVHHLLDPTFAYWRPEETGMAEVSPAGYTTRQISQTPSSHSHMNDSLARNISF